MSIVYLFPGQGSQQPTMINNLPNHKVVERTIEEASMAIGEDVRLRDSAEALASTVSVQLSLLVVSVAIYRLLKNERVEPDIAAGHSVGAFSAAVAAEVLSFSDAIQLVKKRGVWMEEAQSKDHFGMGVVVGLSKIQLSELINKVHSENNPVYLTNENASDQFTISGHKKGIRDVLFLSINKGAKKAELLPVNVPSHCPLLKEVSVKMAQALEDFSFHRPKFPLASNCSARILTSEQKIKEDLARSISNPVRWHEASEVMYEKGGRLFVECSYKSVLKDLAEKAFPAARAISVMQSGIRSSVVLVQRMRTENV